MRTDKQRAKHAEYMRRYFKRPGPRAKKLAANATYREKNWDSIRAIEKKSADKHSEGRYARRLRQRYAITLDEYEVMVADQRGLCAICGGENADGKRLGVDHDHATGTVRGLLCNGCNRKLGWYEILRERIHDYLRSQG